MATDKQAVLGFQLVDEIDTKFLSLLTFLGSSNSIVPVRVRYNLIGSRESKMAAPKLEVLVSQLCT
jgi:hypothetical protein